MSKYVSVPLSITGIDRVIKELDNYDKWLKSRAAVLLERLADRGYTISSAKFGQAVYDGTNDVSVNIETRDENCKAVVAVGNSVLFIEFGTGVTYPDNHPEAAKNGMIRGAYGKGHGKQPTWAYVGGPGTNGVQMKGKPYVLTHGNPANMAMYDAAKQIREDFEQIAREVFR